MYTANLSKSQQQLFDAFCRKSKAGKWQVISSGIETSTGTRPRWNFLKQGGLVAKMPHGGGFGHPFCFNLTEAGNEFLESVCNELNVAYACDASESERNDFSSEGKV